MVMLMLVAAAIVAEPYQAYHYELEASVWDVWSKDLTGEGRSAIFVLCCDEKSRPLTKFLAIYLPDAQGAYPAAPSLRLDLDPSISGVFFAETDGQPPIELVAVDSEGAVIYRLTEGRMEKVGAPRFASLWPYGAREPLFLKSAAIDLDGDGVDEWIVPVASGYEIRRPDAAICRIPCDLASEISGHDSVYITNRLPAVEAFPLEGEAKKALAFLSDEYADFAHGPDWSVQERFKIPVNIEEKWEAEAKMVDIDANSLPDLVVTQTRGTINLEALTQVYLAAGPFTYPDTPTAVFHARGALAGAYLMDVNGDGKRDMIFVSIPFGLRNIVNFFARRKLAVRVEVYLFQDGGFQSAPGYVESFVLDAPEGRERVAYTLGDFNGDGRLDVAFGAAANEFVIHTSSEKQLVSSRPWVTLSIPSFGVARPYNLNGNASQDLIMFHPGGENRRRVDVVVF